MTAKEIFNKIRIEATDGTKGYDEHTVLAVESMTKEKYASVVKECRKWTDGIASGVKLGNINLSNYATQIKIVCNSLDNIEIY